MGRPRMINYKKKRMFWDYADISENQPPIVKVLPDTIEWRTIREASRLLGINHMTIRYAVYNKEVKALRLFRGKKYKRHITYVNVVELQSKLKRKQDD